jgi:hypothetical protein
VTSPVLWCGQEDLSLSAIGSNLGAPNANTPIFIDTTTSHFRSAYARYCINLYQDFAGGNFWIRNAASFASATFWTSGRFFTAGPTVNPTSGWSWMRWLDANGIVRLLIKTANTGATSFAVYTQNAAGTQTQIGVGTTTGISTNPSTPDKIDVYINYASSGTFTLYVNGMQLFTYSGNILTDSNTSLSYIDYGMACASSISSIGQTNCWSECIVATRDTRNMGLVTLIPGAAGNTQAWSSSTANNLYNSGTTSGTYAGSANTIFYSRLNPAIGGPLVSVAMSLNGNVTGTTSMAIYADNGSGGPGTRLATSSTVANPTSGLQTFALSGVTIIGGADYWIAYLSTGFGASYSASQTQSTTANYGGTEGSSSFPTTASGVTLSANYVWVQMTVATPNVGQLQEQDTAPDTSGTASQLQEYETASVLPSGSYSIISLVQHARVTVGSSGPQNISFAVRTGGVDYLTSDISPAPNLGYSLMTYNWDTNPGTTVAWQQADLPVGSTSFNFGYESET